MSGRRPTPVRFSITDPAVAQSVSRIVQLVRHAGGRAWLVGGSVRDLILGRQPQDFDLEVVGLAPSRLQTILSEHLPVDRVGKAFAIFKLHGLPIDISVPSRRPTGIAAAATVLRQADPEMSIDDALSRRDFTINAMAWDLDSSEFRDPFHGRSDLDAHRLRHVSDQFAEDPVRVLRGMQLAARFELTAAPETAALCGTLTQEGQPRERLWEEWKKLLLQGRSPSRGLRWLDDCGWLRFYPELAALQGCEQDPLWHPEGDVWVHTLHSVDWFAAERTGHMDDDLIVGLGVLCHDFGKPATTQAISGRILSRGHEAEGDAAARRFLERLTNQEDLINAVIPLVRCHLRPRALYEANASDHAVRRLARQVGRIDRLVRVARADEAGRPPKPFAGFPAGEWLLAKARHLNVETCAPAPLVMGRHLLELGIPPGPEMGRLLEECYEAQLSGLFCTISDGLVFARQRLSRAHS